MLDTYGRKYINPVLDKLANICIKLNIKANHITIIALFIGLLTGPYIYTNRPIIAIMLLWVSGLLDAVDGLVARKNKNTTAWGTLMDITFDRIVEITIIISLALKHPDARLELLILTSSIILSMTIFLTVGALTEKRGMKSFYYQAGVAERTEGFILFSLMILFNKYLKITTNIFAVLVLITAFQRMIEARKILR